MNLTTGSPSETITKVRDTRKRIFREIAAKRKNQLWQKASLKDVKKIVLISSASRSGSSLLFAILRTLPGTYSLSGESVPFYKLNGLFSDLSPSETVRQEMLKEVQDNADLDRDFISDFSVHEGQDNVLQDQHRLTRYIDNLALRLPMQWPEMSFSYPLFKELAMRAFNAYAVQYKEFQKEMFYLELLRLLRQEYPVINPYYYDIPADLIKLKIPDARPLTAPPNDILTIEEPLFILLSPAREVTEDDLAQKTLILKSTVDCYKMDLIETIFPNAEIKIIYLTRNPAASINGLYDGWCHRGFFSHNLKTFFTAYDSNKKSLKISGYSDKYEWGKWWWKFDLPRQWENYTDKPLEKVCTFQWFEANKTIQHYLSRSSKSFCHVKHENIIKGIESRTAEIEKIIDFMGLNPAAINHINIDKLSVIQSTHPFKPYRWRGKKDIILPLLNDPAIRKMFFKMGYNNGKMEEWI